MTNPSSGLPPREPSPYPPSTPAKRMGPPVEIKVILSLLIVAHFLAILTTVVSAQAAPVFMASPLAIQANEPFRPYTYHTFLQNPYRFYAPNPGPVSLVWYRCIYEDGTIVWGVMPDRDDFYLRMPYQRYLSLTMLLDGNVHPPDNNGFRVPSDLAKVTMASYVRHIADVKSKPNNRVKNVTMYFIAHLLITPEDARKGYQSGDYRLYNVQYAGDYDGWKQDPKSGAWGLSGERTDLPDLQTQIRLSPNMIPRRDLILNFALEHFLTEVLENDIYPLMRAEPSRDKSQLVRDLKLPQPLIDFYDNHPDLLDPRPLVSPPKGDEIDGNARQKLFKVILEYSRPKVN